MLAFFAPPDVESHRRSSILVPLQSPFNALDLICSNYRSISCRFGVTGDQSSQKRQKNLYFRGFTAIYGAPVPQCHQMSPILVPAESPSMAPIRYTPNMDLFHTVLNLQRIIGKKIAKFSCHTCSYRREN